MTTPTAQNTDFSRDVMGRYICNGLDEALRSTDTSVRPDARPFDIIVVGGGTFGSAIAEHMFSQDKTHSHRILVLEGGAFVSPEHVQNLAMLGLDVPGPTSIADLRAAGKDGRARNELWGLAWHSNATFPGLAYCVGGRSVFWGGWSPQLLETELSLNHWPQAVVDALNTRYFKEASRQIGVDVTNDFIYGALHEALRSVLFEGITAARVTDAIPLAQLPLHLDIPMAEPLVVAAGAGSGAAIVTAPGAISAQEREMMKLEAPLAVQTRTRPGFFPFNKFSAVPLVMKAARAAWSESGGDDVKKRLMIVPNCHVKQLIRSDGLVTGIDTNLGYMPVPPGGSVIIALATIESARLVLNSFLQPPPSPSWFRGQHPEFIANYEAWRNRIGKNLMAHLRSNITIRVPRTSLPVDATIKELQASALFVKGRHPVGANPGHFHLQITAAGLGPLGADSEAELFKKVPDIDGFDAFQAVTDSHVVITIRAIGEMEPQNPASSVTLDRELDEFGVQRAFVSLQPSANDLLVWDAMDKASDEVAKVFANNQPFEIFAPRGAMKAGPDTDLRQLLPYKPVNQGGRRDSIGTTHHETGTLWMGNGAGDSVTDSDCRLHQVPNVHIVGPALFPTIGSPNPMLTGIALARRLSDTLVKPEAYVAETGFQALFDGIHTGNWQMGGGGTFYVVDGALESAPGGGELGMYWCMTPTPPDFVLKLEWKRTREDDNSGVFIRFPDPNSKGYNNTAWVAINFGFEVQIDELGAPDGAAIHKTGAIYAQPNQTLTLQPARPVGEWNEYEIRVKDQTYTVLLNGAQVTKFQNPQTDRGLPSKPGAPSYIGLQAHTGRVAFRKIRIKAM